jgi:hypothetical protein
MPCDVYLLIDSGNTPVYFIVSVLDFWLFPFFSRHDLNILQVLDHVPIIMLLILWLITIQNTLELIEFYILETSHTLKYNVH